LIDHLTAQENVQLPLELTGMPRAEAAAKSKVWLEKVGLEQRLKHRPKTLSGGEQQRVALARAFVTEPDMLFADEPTGSLDEQTGAKIIDLLFQLNQELGSTLILVTHDMALATRCQRQMVLNAGRIVSGA
jgi:putative ABC transport system ATP-binding protein